jgi:hypothetical protein
MPLSSPNHWAIQVCSLRIDGEFYLTRHQAKKKKGANNCAKTFRCIEPQKKLRQINLYLPPSPTSHQSDPDPPPHSSYRISRRRHHRTHRHRRGGSSSQVSCVYAASSYPSLSKPHLPISQHPNHNRRR